VEDASARDVATTRGRRHHTEIANLYNASVYLSMQGIASTVTPLSNGTAPIRGPALAKKGASVNSVALTKKELRSKKKTRRRALQDLLYCSDCSDGERI
jgi:hypothetical protein